MENAIRKSKTEMNLTNGNIFLKMPIFSLPLAITTFFQLLYTTIDLATVSKYGGGPLSMSAVGSNSALINLIVTMFVSLATGANVAMSLAKGADDKLRAEKVLHTSLIIALVSGLLVGIFGYFTSPMLLELMDTPSIIFSKATTYLKIYFCGLPFLMVINFCTQMLRALGDSRRPLYILTSSGLVNIGLDFIFVYFFNMDVAGVGLATVISEALSAVIFVLYFIFSKHSYVNLSFRKLHIDKEAFKDVMKIGVPAGLQGVAFSLPNVLIQSSLYTIVDYSINGIAISQGEIVSASAASAQIEGYIHALVDSFAVGLISFVGQNYGAKNKKNMDKSLWSAMIWMVICLSFATTIVLVFMPELLSIFIKESDDVVAYNAFLAGRERMLIIVVPYITFGVLDILGAYLRGMKKSVIPAVAVTIGCSGTRILFILTLFKLPYFHTIFWLYAVYPMSWIAIDILYLFIVPHVRKKIYGSLDEKNVLSYENI